MSKMSELFIDIQEMIASGYSMDKIVEKTGAPYAWVVEVQNSMEAYVMENDYDDGQPDEAQEWYDYDPDC